MTFATFLFALLLLFPAFAVTASAEGPTGFSVHDLVSLDRLGDPQPSPDGTKVAFVVRSTDLEANGAKRDLWWVPTAGGEPQRLTTHDASDSTPRWSPDGSSLYFLSSRSGSSQVWRIPVATPGEAQQVTDLPLSVGGFEVSPSGDRLVVVQEVFIDCEDLDCTVKRLAETESAKTSGVLYDRLFVRHWDHWKDGRRNHIFSVKLSDDGKPATTGVDLSRGLDGDIPSKPFGGTAELAFSPDGETVVFSARTVTEEDGGGEAWSTDFDLWASPTDGSSPPVNFTPENRAWRTHPVFSPDGKTLAFAAMERPGYEADRLRIVLKDWNAENPAAGAERALTQDWDRSVRDFFFTPDGKSLFVNAQDTGHVRLFSVDVDSAEVRPLVSEGTVRSPKLAGDRLVFGLDHLSSPVDLYSIPADPQGEARDVAALDRLTDFNASRLEGVAFGESEQFSFPGWAGETVYGWVVKPANFEAGKKYPVAFLIHGGPQGSFSNNFHYRWNPQTYAGAGYAAVMIDFHGSTGYGQAFTDSIGKDWGGKPLVDLQKGLAWAVENYDFLDGDRVAALGASYGGYMINWIAGQWPDRFRALVNHDGVFDQRSMYYETEELWFPEWEQGGPYFRASENFEKHNPALFVDRWKTPMLVIHGELDYRVPVTQGLGAFTALQRQGIPSQFLYFPDENHWVLTPANSILWHDTVKEWLNRWTAP
ncbi:MAG: S9 family peptidase [Acidobacteriota bacterium]